MKNILVAVGDESLRERLIQAMNRGGYKVHVAQTGREALEKIEKQVFDLIITEHRSGESGSSNTTTRSSPRPCVHCSSRAT